jgi:GNAT superfamily N-acetyltransferase
MPSAELSYFGLMPDFIGRGLGTWLLGTAIETAWARPIERLWVHTNTLDHPRALPNYQRQGFTPYAQEKSLIEPID